MVHLEQEATKFASGSTRRYLLIMSLRRAVRGWTLLWALLQFALPTAATYADAMLEQAGVGAPVTHVEADGTAGCPAVHPADCAICHLVQSRITGADAPSCIPAFTIRRPAQHDTHAAAPPGVDVARVHLPRAPPIV